MDGTRVSDFSIERIFSPQLGRTQPEPVLDGCLRGGFSMEAAGSLAPDPIPVIPVPVVPVVWMCFGAGFCSCSVPFQQVDISFGPNPPGGSEPPLL